MFSKFVQSYLVFINVLKTLAHKLIIYTGYTETFGPLSFFRMFKEHSKLSLNVCKMINWNVPLMFILPRFFSRNIQK